MVKLEPDQGRWAVSLARETVESVVRTGNRPSEPADVDQAFRAERGAFVTLEKGGELRGCIGRPRPEQPAIRAIVDAATGAATDDPRFPPVRAEELDVITVEVSVLTPPTELGDSPSSQVQVGRDGLIVSRDGRSGLLLPQVPLDHEWSATEFLAHTCRKAGLPLDAWQSPDVSVESFEAQVFAEVSPRGPVEVVEIKPEREA